MQEVTKRFGANVRVARLEKGWTQEVLAAKAGMATVQISRIERGAREVRLGSLVRLLAALEVPPAQLLAGTY